MNTRALRFRAAVIAAIVTAAAASFLTIRVKPIRKASYELRSAAAAGDHRVFQGRLVGARHAPPHDVTRGPTTAGVHLAAAAAQALARGGPQSEVALAHALTGNLDAAASILNDVVTRDRRDAAAWNDLAVFRLEIGLRRAQPREIAAAVAATDRALDLRPSMKEAAFTRAVALEELSLSALASSAFEAYLLLDGESEWAGEARTRLEKIENADVGVEWNLARELLEKRWAEGDRNAVAAIVRTFPQEARTWGETIYLGEWGKALLSGDHASAKRAFEIADAIGNELAAWTGEALLADSTAALRGLGSRDKRVAALAQAHYADGRRAYKDQNLDRAGKLLDQAALNFQQVRSPMALVARHFRGNVAFDQGDPARCLSIQNDIEIAASDRYHALRGQVLWQRAIALAAGGRYYEALSNSSRSAKMFERLHEEQNAAEMWVSTAALLARLGDTSRAWEAWDVVFRRVNPRRNPGLLARALDAAARNETRESSWDIARALFRLQLQLKQPARVRFDALLWSAYAAFRTGDIDRTSLLADLDRTAAEITDATARQAAMRDAAFARATLLPSYRAQEAVDLLSEVITGDEREGQHTRLPYAYRERAKLYRLLKDDNAAISDLSRATSLVAEAGSSVATDDLRGSFFGSAQALFAELADLLAARGAHSEAFDALARRPISRSLHRLPADTIIVQPAVFDDHLILAIGDRSGAQIVSVAVRRIELISLIDSFRSALRRNDAASVAKLGRRLYSLLIEPLPRFNHLFIVEDETIAPLPFAALQTASGEFLAERATVSIISALSVTPTTDTTERRKRVLVIGDPAFDTNLFPDLARLPAAAAEAEAIARLHGGQTIAMTGREATSENLISKSRDVEILHIGAHALVNAHDARDSALILSTPLYARDIRNFPLGGKPVVVLAGCRTALAGGGRGTMRSLSSAFLAAGSRAVIASLWDVYDAEAAAFAFELHTGLAQGVHVRDALRNAQLTAIRNGWSRGAWSSFQVYEPAAEAARERW